MRKRKKGRKLHRKADQRKALIKSLIFSLIEKEAIITTLARAKEIRPIIEKMITKINKKSSTNALRIARKTLPPKTAKKLVSFIAPRYKDRPGGYTRIIKLGPRKSDSCEMARIEFV